MPSLWPGYASMDDLREAQAGAARDFDGLFAAAFGATAAAPPLHTPSPAELQVGVRRLSAALRSYAEESPQRLRAAVRHWKDLTAGLGRNHVQKGQAAWALGQALETLGEVA